MGRAIPWRGKLSLMSFGLFSPVEVFKAAHAYTWFSVAEDTASLAAEVRSDGTLWLWQAALTYVKHWPPAFVFPTASSPIRAESHRNLTVSEGREVRHCPARHNAWHRRLERRLQSGSRCGRPFRSSPAYRDADPVPGKANGHAYASERVKART